MKIAFLIGLLILLSGCASIEERCLNQMASVPADLRDSYFNSCVETKRQKKQALQQAFNSVANGYKHGTTCTSNQVGNQTYTTCN